MKKDHYRNLSWYLETLHCHVTDDHHWEMDQVIKKAGMKKKIKKAMRKLAKKAA